MTVQQIHMEYKERTESTANPEAKKLAAKIYRLKLKIEDLKITHAGVRSLVPSQHHNNLDFYTSSTIGTLIQSVSEYEDQFDIDKGVPNNE